MLQVGATGTEEEEEEEEEEDNEQVKHVNYLSFGMIVIMM
jgi:hypothetical protein